VICLEAPEAVEVPRSLLRADGRSIYQRHGGVRYATRAQLVMEERLVAQAGAEAAPRLTHAGAARGLGADLARLEDALAGRAQEIQDHHPERTQLTAEQAAAVLSVLTDDKRVSVINAPAGSGKTRVMTEAARIWAAAGRPVVGITPSQSARNTLAAGVPESYNTAQFLGHLPGQRGARGPLDITEDTLLLVDESSMIPTPDLADVVSLAEARRAKMVLAGDTGQLQAVENGGAMSLLADPVQAPVGSAQVRSRTARVEMTDAQPHRPVHRVAVKVIARHPPHLAALITARRRATRRAGGQDNGKLLPDFAVAGVKGSRASDRCRCRPVP
jgi:ATP-dependent exoDNAse (exonuclease V) alpha subunit